MCSVLIVRLLLMVCLGFSGVFVLVHLMQYMKPMIALIVSVSGCSIGAYLIGKTTHPNIVPLYSLAYSIGLMAYVNMTFGHPTWDTWAYVAAVGYSLPGSCIAMVVCIVLGHSFEDLNGSES